MPCTHKPRLEIDISVVVEIGLSPLDIVVVGHVVLDDAHHVLGIEHVDFSKVTRSAYVVTYPIPCAATVKKMLIDEFSQFIAAILILLYDFFNSGSISIVILIKVYVFKFFKNLFAVAFALDAA